MNCLHSVTQPQLTQWHQFMPFLQPEPNRVSAGLTASDQNRLVLIRSAATYRLLKSQLPVPTKLKESELGCF